MPELQQLATEQRAAAKAALSEAEGNACVFNPLPLARQCVFEGRLVQLPPLAGVQKDAATIDEFTPIQATSSSLTNGLITLQLNRRGELARLSFRGEEIAVKPGTGQLILYPDRAANYEAWDIDRQALALGAVVRTPATAAIVNVQDLKPS